MDIDPMDSVEGVEDEDAIEERGKKGANLTALVAITVALLAAFMAVCKVKDDNIRQDMQVAQANRVDDWGYYQARNLREEISKSTLVQLGLQQAVAPATQQAAYAAAVAKYEALAAEQSAKKKDAKTQAEADGAKYEALDHRHDQFDLSDALLAIAISLLAMTALTRKHWLYMIALLPTAFGVLMGLAGLAGWNIHPDVLASLLN